MLRSVGVEFYDVPELSSIENFLRRCNENHRDRQIRVKLEAYASTNKEKVASLMNLKVEIPEESKSAQSTPKSGSKRDYEEIDLDGLLIEAIHGGKKAKVEQVTGLVVPFSVRLWNGKHPKKTLFKNLVRTLNLAFGDYDFGSVKLEQFRRRTLSSAMATVHTQFSEMCSSSTAKVFNKDLWRELEDVIGNPIIDPNLDEVVGKTLEGTQIYSYVPENDADIDADPLSLLGNLWSFNYFFCNPALGKVVFLACSCRQRKFSQSGDSLPELVSHNSFYEAWEEQDMAAEDESAPLETEAVTSSLENTNLQVAF